MSQNVVLKAAGLYSFPNHLSTVPNGALLKADNVVINRDAVIESRRGYKIYGNAIGTSPTSTAHQLLNYKGRLLRHYGPGPGTLLEYDSNGSGNFQPFEITLSGTTTNASPNITGISSTAFLSTGMFINGTGIPAGATVQTITDKTSIVISA